MTRIIICGGGLAGGLAAIALAKRRPDIEFVLVDEGDSVGGNHIWSFFDSDISPEGRWLVDEIARRRWPDHEIRFPKRSRVIPLGYNSVQSGDLDAAARASLGPHRLRLGARVTSLGPTHVEIGSESIEGDCVIDARGKRPMGSLELGWQKFLGRVFRFNDRHGVTRPMIMDGAVPQFDGYRFIYLLPLSERELLIEDTYYSGKPVLDCSKLGLRLQGYAQALERGPFEAILEESGVLPVIVAGTIEDLWPRADPVPRLGLGGGFFHPTTGYSFPDAIANAVLLSEQRNWTPAAIKDVLWRRADRLWRERRFFQILNRMLFRAAEPDERYRVLEHFYRLPQGTIERFYAAQLKPIDKLRILSGRPPIGVRKALAALSGRVA